jgi:predicted Zn-ribbon and HTH transcriptional regulator
MKHTFARTFTGAAPLPAPLLLPLSPSGYLRLRRSASGQSITAVAQRLNDAHVSAHPGMRNDITTALIASLETEGVVAKHRQTLDRLRSVIPFDPDVYHQLATEPAALHPAVCRTCGTSAWDHANACPGCRSGADR